MTAHSATTRDRTDATVVGRVSTRPRSVDEVLAQADLPESLATLVRTTVQLTRLRHSERTDIARELVSHLREGLDAEVDPRRLAADFGDPKVIAPLLRTAARRRRDPLDRALTGTIKWAFITIAAVVVVYALLAVRLATMEPRIAFSPVDRLNAIAPNVPVQMRAWPLYRDAMRWHHAMRAGPDGRWVGAAITTGTGESLVTSTPDPARESRRHREADIAEIRARQSEIALLRRAASMPALGRPITTKLDPEDIAYFGSEEDWGDPSWEILIPFPHLTELRGAGTLLVADASVALMDGDPQRAVDDFIAALGVARHVGEHPIIISQLVETAILTLVADSITHALEQRPEALSDEHLRQLAQAIAVIPDTAWLIDLRGERIWFEHVVQHVFSDDGRGGGVMLTTAASRTGAVLGMIEEDDRRTSAIAFAVGPLAAVVAAGRRETLELADRLYGLMDAEAHLPIVTRPHAIDFEVERMMSSKWQRVRHPVITLMMPALSKASVNRSVGRGVIDGAAVAIALQRWRRAHGEWPDSLEDLVPELLDDVPIDVFDHQPIRYRLDPQGPLVWAVGPDGVDDGGTVAVQHRTSERTRRPMNRRDLGDFILFDGRASE